MMTLVKPGAFQEFERQRRTTWTPPMQAFEQWWTSGWQIAKNHHLLRTSKSMPALLLSNHSCLNRPEGATPRSETSAAPLWGFHPLFSPSATSIASFFLTRHLNISAWKSNVSSPFYRDWRHCSTAFVTISCFVIAEGCVENRICGNVIKRWHIVFWKPIVLTTSACTKASWNLEILCRLQAVEHINIKGFFSSITNRWNLGFSSRLQIFVFHWAFIWLIADTCGWRRPRENCLCGSWWDMRAQGNAFRPLQHPSRLRAWHQLFGKWLQVAFLLMLPGRRSAFFVNFWRTSKAPW